MIPMRNRLALAAVMAVAFVAASWPTWQLGLAVSVIPFGLVYAGWRWR